MTSRDFSKLIGVSQSTVSRALNNSSLVPKEKKEYICQKALEYRFVLNNSAKSLKTSRTGTIGVLWPRHFVGMSFNLMLSQVYDCIQLELNKYDYDVMPIYYKNENENFSSFERVLKERKVDGFIVLRMELSDREKQLIEEYKVPCVFFMNAGKNVRSNFNHLFSDSEYGGYLAGQYFGYFKDYRKKIITVEEEKYDAKRRLQGFKKALKEHGYNLQKEDVFCCNLSIESAYQCIIENKSIFKNTKTAIFTYNDLIGIGVINACKDIGLKIPKQVQVIGMDNINLSKALTPRLSTIHVPVSYIVIQGSKLLIDLINKKECFIQEWVKPTLILRETTKSIYK